MCEEGLGLGFARLPPRTQQSILPGRDPGCTASIRLTDRPPATISSQSCNMEKAMERSFTITHNHLDFRLLVALQHCTED